MLSFFAFFPKKNNNNKFCGRTHYSILFDRYYCTHTHTHEHIGHISTISGRFFSRLLFNTGIIIHLFVWSVRAKLVYSIHVHGLLLMCTRSSLLMAFNEERKNQAVIVCFSSIRKINDTKCARARVFVCVFFFPLCINIVCNQ